MRRFRAFVIEYCERALRNAETKRIAVEFCTEVAVLLAVFPWLETIIANRSAIGGQQIGIQNVNWFVAKSLLVAALFLTMAIIMAVGRGD